ncbi:GNAT family N-acetyltransferase [Butyrivibrio sp. AE3006]|uniref:GNAT family N-acetyltransferase n=1 Tax=Butyrivibrio sp. AE3006 TaxID=1280673 RepID=UPI00047EE5A4|nr:GNAT family N-acetyltransferase [Butyrivibrio sp. AE3006]
MNHNYNMQSEGVKLTPMTAQDSEKYRILRNRKDNISFFFSGKEITSDQQAAWYKKYLDDDTQYMFSIYEKNSDNYIGGIGIYDIDTDKRTAEVGRIIVDREIAGGKHYGAAAISLLIELARNELKLNSLYANIYSTNKTSLKSFLRAGFVEDSVNDSVTKVVICLGE